MQLRQAIASYSGQSYAAIKALISAEVLGVVAQVAASPLPPAELDGATCDELVEMHVFAEEDGLVRLDTAVFLEADIERINVAAARFGRELSARVAEAALPMRAATPWSPA